MKKDNIWFVEEKENGEEKEENIWRRKIYADIDD